MRTLAIVLVCACGGSTARPGLDGNRRAADSNASEYDELCTWEVEVTGGPRSVACPDNLTVNFKSKADCLANQPPASCQATVGQLEDCIDALDADPCSLGGSTCQPLFACGM